MKTIIEQWFNYVFLCDVIKLNDKEEPNFKFMEEYMKSILQKEIDCIKNYCKKTLCQIEYKEIEELRCELNVEEPKEIIEELDEEE